MIIQVSLTLNITQSLSYRYTGDPLQIKPGMRVVVPVGNRLTSGWVIDTHSEYRGKAKDVVALVRDTWLPSSLYLDFVKAVADVYFVSPGILLDSALPPARKNLSAVLFKNPQAQGKVEKLMKYSLAELTTIAAGQVIEAFYKLPDSKISISEAPLFPVEPVEDLLLPGQPQNQFIIDYHREEHYLPIIRQNLQQGRSVLITLPDNLSAEHLYKFLSLHLLQVPIHLYNSRLKPKERDQLWHEYAITGKIGVIIGGASAVCLPIGNLGLIICERAGSPAYKNRFFAKQDIHFMSRLRAQASCIPFVEGFSAYTVQAYRERAAIAVQDLRSKTVGVAVQMIKQGSKGIPADFIERVGHYYSQGKKILIVLNRKESIDFLFCPKCKKVCRCPACDRKIDVVADFHIKCSFCNEERQSYTLCAKCNSQLTIVENLSIASVRKALKSRVVETGIQTISAEALGQEHISHILQQTSQSPIVVATPIILNPVFRDFFDVAFYLQPETHFDIEQYDAAEQIYAAVAELKELLKPDGVLEIFSTFHFHYALKLLEQESQFFERELNYREWFHLPPYANLYHIEVKDKNLRQLARDVREIYRQFKEQLGIKRVYLAGRTPSRGFYKVIIEAHTQPASIHQSALATRKNITVELVLF